MGEPQSTAQRVGAKGARKGGIRSSSLSECTMKPEQFAQRRSVRRPVNLKVDVEHLEEVPCPPSPQTVEVSPVKKRMVDTRAVDDTQTASQTAPTLARPLNSRRRVSRSFLQPEQFIAELKVKAGADIRSDLSVNTGPLSSSEPPPKESPKQAQVCNGNDGQQSRPEIGFEPAHSVPTLELCYDGKPAPAPAHLRTRTGAGASTNSTPPLLDKSHRNVETGSAQPGQEPGESCGAAVDPQDPPANLQKSSSQGSGRFFKGGNPALLKLQATSALSGKSLSPGNAREKLVRSVSGKKDSSSRGGDNSSGAAHSLPIQLPNDVDEGNGGVKQTSRLRRMLHWGASRTGSMEFLRSLERKLGKKSGSKVSSGLKSGKIGEYGLNVVSKVEQRVEAESEQEGNDLDILDEALCSPRSSASSVSTTYSEVSSKSQSYKHSRTKTLNSESTVKSRLWFLRVHQKLQGRATKEPEDEGDGIYDALRAATFHYTADITSSRDEEKKISASSNLEKLSIAKLVAKHKRNSTWDAGKRSLADHPFSPNQPRLPTCDAHVLLTPPRKLTADTRETDFQRRRGKPSLLNTQLPDASKGDGFTVAAEAPAAPEHQAALGGSQQITLNAASPGSAESQGFARSPVQNAVSPSSPPGTLPSSQKSSMGSSFPGFSSPLPLPVKAGSRSSPTSPGVYAASPGNAGLQSFSRSAGLYAASPGGGEGGMQSTGTSPGLYPTSQGGWAGLHSPPTSPRPYAGASPGGAEWQSTPTSPGLYAASSTSPELYVTSPGGAGFQSSLTSPGSQRLNTGEQFSLEDSASLTSSSVLGRASLVKHTVTRAAQEEPRAAAARNGVTGPKPWPQELASTVSDERESLDKHRMGGGNALPLPASPRPQAISFEQIVAGRGRSPPTDNTLMKFFFKCREIEHLNKFLALQKRRFLESSINSDSEKCFHMILSQAGAGVSSMVSTLCTAWLLENTLASATAAKWHPIPVMNMRQNDMWQHRDTAWLFHVCGIEANAVLFLDEITPTNETVVAGRVKRAVIGQDILVTKDEVESSCTIVAEKFRQEAPKLLQARYMKTLLLAGILVDTNNLSSGSSRDKEQATNLLVGAGSLGRNGFYNHLMNIRDEKYVTSFIKEIYGDSNALTGEKPAHKGQNGEKIERPTALATRKVSSEVSAPVSPLPVPSQKSTTKLSETVPSEKKELGPQPQPQPQPRTSQNSKISLAFRRLRNRSSAQ